MKNYIKTTIVALALSTGFALTGCSVVSAPTTLSDADFTVLVNQDTSDVKNAARLGTEVYLLTVKNTSDRNEIGAFANEAATAVVSAISTDQLQLDGVKQFALDLINKSNVSNKQVTGLIFDAVVSIVEDRLGNVSFTSLTADRKVLAEKTLINAAATGIQQATLLYKNVAPATKPTLKTVTTHAAG